MLVVFHLRGERCSPYAERARTDEFAPRLYYREAEIGIHTPNPSAGMIVKDPKTGEPTGMIRNAYSALKGLPAGARERYLVKSDGGFEVSKRLRDMMVFGEHDLGERAPFPRIDLLLYRNVLIYFAAPMQRVALETFALLVKMGAPRIVLKTRNELVEEGILKRLDSAEPK